MQLIEKTAIRERLSGRFPTETASIHRKFGLGHDSLQTPSSEAILGQILCLSLGLNFGTATSLSVHHPVVPDSPDPPPGTESFSCLSTGKQQTKFPPRASCHPLLLPGNGCADIFDVALEWRTSSGCLVV